MVVAGGTAIHARAGEVPMTRCSPPGKGRDPEDRTELCGLGDDVSTVKDVDRYPNGDQAINPCQHQGWAVGEAGSTS